MFHAKYLCMLQFSVCDQVEIKQTFYFAQIKFALLLLSVNNASVSIFLLVPFLYIKQYLSFVVHAYFALVLDIISTSNWVIIYCLICVCVCAM